ncbi:MAG: hypothetical protein DHS20C19_12240 [Acidimicrobiales bacterium]|nr:MAG: hypothetical protein DHS20C19_12240 [Acidimicrobiales bacterium]
MLGAAACSGGDGLDGERLATDPTTLIPAVADAMGDVERVRFDLERRGAPIYIDPAGSIAVDSVAGTVTVPDQAEALLTVTIDGSITTQLGAIAEGGETLLSNPVTGVFEPLPAGYDLDPREFFDPVGGWMPLIEGLEDVAFVEEVNRGGPRYLLRAIAPAARIGAVTAGLIDGEDVAVDLWVHPVSARVTAVEFDTGPASARTTWIVEFSEYDGEVADTGPSTGAVAVWVVVVLLGVGLLVVIVRPLIGAQPAPAPGAAPAADRSEMSDRASVENRVSPRAVLITVAFSVFVAADDLTVVSTMLRPIIGDLGLVLPDGLDDAAWIVNVYLIAFVAVMPIAGRLSDVIGRRNTFIGAYTVFLVGTTLIPLMDSLGPFLAARVLTAIGGGAMVPVALAVVGDAYPEAKRARALGTLAAIETLGWVWGPMYGAILVRFLSWEWQFWLNIPLALGGMAAVWWALSGHDQGRRATSVDWRGAVLLTAALVSLNLALLGDAEVQSVTGFDQLTGGDGFDFRWLYALALLTGGLFVWHQQVVADPLIDRSVFRGRSLRVALAVNFIVGASLVISMVDVPIFINAVEIDLENSAVAAGWVLSALTAAMALTSYLGGRLTAASGYRLPILLGMGAAVLAYLLMGFTWEADTPYWVLGAQLGLLGAGLGLVSAPTSAAVVDTAAPDKRGAAAATLMVVRLMGLSVGLSLLTAWGLARFNALRDDIDLPPIGDPAFEDAVIAAQGDLTATAIAETFLAAAVVTAVGLALAFVMRNRADMPDDDPTDPPPPPETSANTETGVPMPGLQRHLVPLVGALGALVLLCLVLVAVLFARLGDRTDELAQTRDDLERVEAGAALYASQVTGFQEQLLELEPTIAEGLDEAIAGLEEFAASSIDFDVTIDEVVQIDTEIVLDEQLQVPISESLPIQETFDTRIEVETPLGFSVPLDVTVPVDIDVPVELDLDIAVNQTVPVNATVPVQLDIPIAIDVSETQLADLAQSLAAGLRSLEGVLAGLGGE